MLQSRGRILRDLSKFRTVTAIVLTGLAIAFPGRAVAAVIFSDSFESGNGSAWGYSVKNSGYVNTGCQDGTWCGTQTARAHACDQSLFWSRGTNFGDEDVYIKMWIKFPTNWNWQKSDACTQSSDFKIIIFETSNRDNRCFLNFRGGSGSGPSGSADIAFICEGTDDKWTYGPGGEVRADGQWHSLQVHLDRAGDHVDVWWDDVHIINKDDPICSGSSCPRLTEIKVGAYMNWPPVQTQTFYVDNVTIATTRIGGSSPTIPSAPSNLHIISTE
jgi:hypothetical protein